MLYRPIKYNYRFPGPSTLPINKGRSEPQLERTPYCQQRETYNQDQTLSNDSVRHIRHQNTHTAGGAGLEPTQHAKLCLEYLPLDHLPPSAYGGIKEIFSNN
jgi:hypothetical protein